jgi:hypothetical protein
MAIKDRKKVKWEVETHCCLFHIYFVFSQVMLPPILQNIANNDLATQGFEDSVNRIKGNSSCQ